MFISVLNLEGCDATDDAMKNFCRSPKRKSFPEEAFNNIIKRAYFFSVVRGMLAALFICVVHSIEIELFSILM